MPYEPQDFYQARQAVLTANKQTTYGTAVAAANLLHKLRFDGGAFARIAKEYRTDMDRAGKGHPWTTERQPIQQQTGFQLSGELTNYLAGWLHAFMFSKVTTTGAGPYTHTFIFENATNQAPSTTLYFQDTADIKYTMPDLSMSDLEISGTEKGPLSFSASLVGSGRYTDGANATADAAALPTNIYLLGSDTDILLGPVGAAVSIKERVRGWSIKIQQELKPHYAPGGGMFASFNKMGPQRVSLSLQVAAKDTDDIRTLFLGDTLRELQINTNSGATGQMNYTFKGVYFSGINLGLDGNEEIWSIDMDESSVIKNGVNEILTAVAINSQTTFLVAA